MADIRIREYCKEARDLIEAKRVDQSIAICRYILQRYPHCLEAYLVLGQACLQMRDFGEAQAQFQRVLSADPENFTARVGQAKACEGQGDTNEAIWQMERAFELSPGSAEVRQELQRLYERRGGAAPSRPSLTRNALGRLYARGQLFTQAVQEFRAVLAESPDRVDVQVALAETYWRSGQKLAAAEVCQPLVNELPHCLKANLILGHLWHYGDHGEDADKCLQAAKALDPENNVAQQLLGPDSPLQPEEVSIPRLEKVPALVGPQPEPSPKKRTEVTTIDWLKQLEEEETAPAAGKAEGIPDWLPSVSDDILATIARGTAPEAAKPKPGAAGARAEGASGLASWEQILSSATPALEKPAEKKEERPEPRPRPSVGREPSAKAPIETAQPTPAAPVEGLPDWIEQLRSKPDEEMEPTAAVLPGEEEGKGLWEQILTKGEGAPEGIVESQPEESAELDETLDWMQADVGEIPDWIKFLEPGASVQAPDKESGRTAEVPEWLETALEDSLPAQEIPRTTMAAEVPDWLSKWDQEEELAEAEPTAEMGDLEGLPDWLRSLRETSTEEPQEEQPEAPVGEVYQAEPQPPKEEVPEWLRKLREGMDTTKVPEKPEIPTVEEEAGGLTEVEERAMGRALWEQILAEEGLDLEAVGDMEAPALAEEAAPAAEVDEEAMGRALWEQILAEEGLDLEAAGDMEAPALAEEAAPAAEVDEEAMGRALWEQILAEEGLDLEAAGDMEAPALPEEKAPSEEEEFSWLQALVEEEAVPAVLEPTPAAPIEISEEEIPLEQILAEEGLDLKTTLEVDTTPPADTLKPVEQIEEGGTGEPLWQRLFAEEEPAPTKPASAFDEDAYWRKILAQEGIELADTPKPVEAITPEPEAEEQAPWEQILVEEGIEMEAAPEPVEAVTPEPEAEEQAPWEQILAQEGIEMEAAPEPVEAVALEPEGEEQALWERILAEEGIEMEAAAEPTEAAAPVPELESKGPGWLDELVRFEEEEDRKEAEAARARMEEAPPPVEEKPEAAVAPSPVAKEPAPAETPAEELPHVAKRLAKVLKAKEEKGEEVAVAVEPTPPKAPTSKHEVRLFEARDAVKQGKLSGAVKSYDRLIKSGSLIDAVIADLESLVKAHPNDHTIRQLLGDAYMKDGRLEKALETYRNALAKL